MIRVVVFLIAAGLLALGVVWLADRPGQVAITWLGYRADTSVMVAVVAVIAVATIFVRYIDGLNRRTGKAEAEA